MKIELTIEHGQIIADMDGVKIYAIRPVREEEWGTWIVVTDAGECCGGSGLLVTARGEFRALELVKDCCEGEDACITRKMKFVEEEVESVEEVYGYRP